MFFVLILLGTVVNAQNKDVAYVVRVNTNQDFISVLNDLSLSFDIINSNTISSTNLSTYNMLLIGDEFFPNAFDIPVSKHNSLVVNTFHVDDFGLSLTNPGVTMSSQPLTIKNVDVNKWVTLGLPTILQTYTQPKELYSLNRADLSGISRYIVTIKDNANDPDHVVAVVMPGKKLFNNKISQGRITFFGVTESSFWTSDAEELFKRSLLFTLRGFDSDQDGFGNVVTGGNDCNDADSGINPGETEIPYDGIDQNCDGKDLVDVDNDSFLEMPFGLDCDDNDPSINPNATEILDSIDQNCRNDPPVLIDSIPNITINEDSINTDLIDLSSYFVDTDGDQLSFTSNGNSNINIDINDNFAYLIPDNNFAGQERIRFTASDNIESVSSNEFLLKVMNVNDQPVLKANIPDITWNEDETYSLNLNDYFEDIDNDPLTFSFKDNLFINAQISSNQLVLSAPENWYGSDNLIITASDSLLSTDSNNVNILVNSVNDKPNVISIKKIDQETSLETETFFENKSYLFKAEAEDIDDSSLVYEWFLDNNLIEDQDEFVYLFDFNSQGSRILKLVVKDAESETVEQVQIFINNVNRQPYFEMANEISINEDENKLLDIIAVDPDNDNLVFGVASSENILCKINQNKLEIIPENNFVGQETCILTASDNIDSIEINILIEVLAINDGPLILSTSPLGSQKILQDTEIKFEVEIEDVDSQEIFYEWYFNNNLESIEKEFTYLFSQPGINEIKLILNDDGGETEEHTWTINVVENVDDSDFDGETTDFFNVDLNNIQNLILEKSQFGKILFLETVSLGQNKDINNNVIISKNVVAVNSDNLPELNKKARITLRNQEYVSKPQIFSSQQFTDDISLINEVCEECRLISFSQEPTNDGVVVFEVIGFSSYAVKSADSNEEVNGLCENGEKGDINLKLLEPDDEVSLAEDFKVQLKTKEEDDLVAEITLIDENGDEVLGETEEINDKESEFTYDLNDIDEGEYTLFVKVYEEDNEENSCSEKQKQIQIERPDHEVSINSFSIEPNTLECNKEALATVNIENLGKKSEDVSLNLYNKELGISLNQEIALDKYSKRDNKEKVFFNFNLPKIEKESYDFELTLNYEDTEKITKTVKANKCPIVIQNTPVVKKEFENIIVNKKPKDNSLFLVSNIIFLIIMIYMLLILL